MPSALVISYHAPQPDRDSGARRVFHFLELLQEEGWDVGVLAADGAGPQHDVRVLGQRGIPVYDGFVHSLREVFDDRKPDLTLIAYWPNVERFLPRIRSLAPETRILVDSVDLHFLRESREALVGDGRRLDESHGGRYIAEINAYANADLVLTVSSKEADLINDLVWDHSLARPVPDFEDAPGHYDGFSRRRGVVCIGSFEHPPNIEAVRFLCQEILPFVAPELLAEHPVWIVGNKPTQRVKELASELDHVHVVGWVPSVLPYLARARVSVVPLLYGAGTKRKLLQALATGTPTVSTSIGIEGLPLRHEEHVLVADEPKAFASNLTKLLVDAELWSGMARAGRREVRRTHGKRIARRLFHAAVQEVLRREPKPAPAEPSRPVQERTTGDEYEQLVERFRVRIAELVPSARSVLVVSRGDDRLLDLNGHRAGHFPQDESGKWAGYHPRDSESAIEELERLRSTGADALVFPSTMFWWFDFYPDLVEHLASSGELVHRDDECAVFSLRAGPADLPEGPSHVGPRREPPEPPIELDSSSTDGVRLIAFYLPQFHPIPENDAWWGRGFTEWRNVARGRPMFPDHYQPHVPADLGFYDLRLAETRQRQAELARASGIHGFCYYHYWFHGKRLLYRPFDEVLASGEPNFPFALCWANDPWSRRWDGREDELLQAQTYSARDDRAHIQWLLPALSDPRAITVDGKPLFLVYRASHLPEPTRTCETWRHEVGRAGLPGIHLVAVETAWELGWDATEVGFDAKVLFQPQFGWLMTHVTPRHGRVEVPGKDDLQVYDYDVVCSAVAELEPVNYRRYECVFPGWDNTSRVGERAVVIHNASPASYEAWLRGAIERVAVDPLDHRLIFVNAWNEWAEGCHLEPDLRHGHAFLNATKRAIRSRPGAAADWRAHDPSLGVALLPDRT